MWQRRSLTICGQFLIWFSLFYGIVARGQESAQQDAQQKLLRSRDRLEHEANRLDEIGKPSEALEKVRQMLAAEREAYGSDHDEIAGSLTWIAKSLAAAGDYRAAATSAREAMEMLTRLFGPESDKSIDAKRYVEHLNQLAELDKDHRSMWQEANRYQAQTSALIQQRDFERAATAAQQAVDLYRQSLGDNSLETAKAWFQLARTLDQQLKFSPALDAGQHGLKIFLQQLGPSHSEVRREVDLLSDRYERLIEDLVTQGEFSSAAARLEEWDQMLASVYESSYWERRYLDLRRREITRLAQLPADQLRKYQTATQQIDQSKQLMSNGKGAEAERLLRQALADLKQLVGTDDRRYLLGTQLLGDYLGNDQLEEAVGLMRQFVATYERLYGTKHPRLKMAQEQLVNLLKGISSRQFGRADFEAASASSVELLAISERLYGPDDSRTRDARANLQIAKDYSRLPADKLARALDTRQKADALVVLSTQQREWEAITLAQEIVDVRREIFGEQHREYAKALRSLAAIYVNLNDHDRAVSCLRQVVDLQRSAFGSDYPEFRDNLDLLTDQLERVARRHRAEFDSASELVVRQELVDRLTELLGDSHWQVRHVKAALSETEQMTHLSEDDLLRLREARRREQSGIQLKDDGQSSQALPLVEHATQVHREVLGEQSPTHLHSLDVLADVRADIGKLEQAQKDYQMAVAVARQIYGDVHPGVVSRLRALANFAKNKEDWQQQQEALWEAYLTGIDVFGRKHGYTADLRLTLEESLRLGEITTEQRQAAQQGDQAFQEANRLTQRGDTLEAFDEASRAYDQYRKAYGDRWPGYSRVRRLLGNLQHDLYHLDEAQRHYLWTLDHDFRWGAENCRRYIDTLSDLADAFAEQKNLNAAESARRQVLSLELQLADNRSWRVGMSMDRLERTERLGRAEQRESRTLRDATKFEEKSAEALARNDLDEGIRFARKAIELRARLVGVLREDDLGFQERLNNFADLLVTVGQQHLDQHQFQLARAAFQESLQWLSRAYPAGHWRLKQAAYDLDEVNQWESLDSTQLAAIDEARRLQTNGAAENPDSAAQIVSLLTQALGEKHLRTLHAEFQYLRMVRGIIALDEAALKLQSIAATLRDLNGSDAPPTRSVLTALASVHRSRSEMLEQKGDLAGAEAAMREALQLQKELADGRGPIVILDQMQIDRIQKVRQLDDAKRQALAAARSEMAELARHVRAKDFAEAIRISRQWELITREVFGDDSIECAAAMQTTGDVLQEAGEIDPAFEKIRRAWEIALKRGDFFVHQVPITNSLANAMRAKSQKAADDGQWKAATDICRELLVSEQAVFGDNHWILRREEVAIGDLLRMEGMSPEDRKRLQQAKSSQQLARELKDQGNVQAAIDALRQTVRDLETVWGKDHHQVAEPMELLADLYVERGWYDLAEPLYRRAIQACWSSYGPQHGQTIRLYGQLSRVYSLLGDPSRAIWHLQEGYQAYQQLMEVGRFSPEMSSDFVTFCTNFLEVLDAILDGMSPEIINKSAGQINLLCQNFEQSASVDDPLFARVRRSRANLLAKRGLYAEAEQLLSETVATLARAKSEPNVELNLSRAEYAAALGKHLAAEQMLNQVISQLEAQGRETGPNYFRSLKNLAVIYQATGRRNQAVQTLIRCLQTEQDYLGSVFAIVGERQAFDQLSRFNRTLKMLLSIAAEPEAQADDKNAAFEWVLRRKGILFDSLCQFRRQQIIRGNDPQIQNVVTRLNQLRQHLATATIRPDQGLLVESQSRQQAWLNDQIQRQETELRRILAEKIEDRRELNGPTVSVDSIRARLPADVALVEFIRTEPFDFHASGGESPWRPAHYVAFVVVSAQDSGITMIDLGPAAEIDAMIEETREQVALGGSGPEPQRELDYRLVAQALYRRLFQPLESAIGNNSTIYLSPDSELNRIGFETLVDESGKYLVERFLIAYLSSGRDLLRTQSSPAQGTIVFANPNYATDTATAEVPADAPEKNGNQTSESAPNQLVASELPRDARGREWERLSGTENEATDLEKLLRNTPWAPVKVYKDAAAREEVFKRIRPPRLLHIATHGYCYADEMAETSPDQATEVRGSAGVTAGYARLRRVENPLLRSGLILAGANRIAANDRQATVVQTLPPADPPDESPANTTPRLVVRDDGWLTAEEISSLDLRGTDLVVLSACQTGLGDIQTGEGVQGLRRAFLYAGASTLITSLYNVPDANTREFMQAFYRALIQGKSKVEALHKAQIATLEQRRTTQRAAHPYFWGSFILIGPN
ncbi:MAG: CHAT domain-containing protein [Pirellulales bacterium]